MYRIIILSIATLLSLNAYALETYEWSMDINTGSKHSNSSYGKNQYYNEENDGVGLTYGYSQNIDIKVGFFENSYYRTTVYAGAVLNKDFNLFNNIVVSPGIGFMLATGYDNTAADAPIIAPIVHPSISFGHKALRSTIGYIPYGEDKVITFQTQILF